MSSATRWCAVAFAVPLSACVHLPMMGAMGLGIGMMGHPRGANACDSIRLAAGALRQDLSRLRRLNPTELGAFMPEHGARIRGFLRLQRPAREDHSHDAH